MDVTIGLAFLAGVIAFISPCVLPLVPAYIGYMGGRVTSSVASSLPGSTVRVRLSAVLHALSFVAGFTLVFVALGLAVTAFIQQVGGINVNLLTGIIGRLGGLVIVFFGLHFAGVIPHLFRYLRQRSRFLASPVPAFVVGVAAILIVLWGFAGSLLIWDSSLWQQTRWVPITAIVVSFAILSAFVAGGAFTAPSIFWERAMTALETALYSDTRRQFAASGRQGLGSSALMGVIFSAGWTPCIGPVYGAVLTMAASGGSTAQAGLLLAAYSLGLGFPFLMAAVMLDGAQGLLRRLRRHMRTVELTSGAFLILIGLMVASGQLQGLSAQFANQFADLSFLLEEAVIRAVAGN